MAARATLCFLLVAVPAVMSDCRPGPPPNCQDWNVGVNRVRHGGTVVHGHVSGNLHQSPSGTLQGTVHGQRVFGGPHRGAQTVGGNLDYQHRGGLHGGVGATHTRGLGTSYDAHVGGSSKVGPGTLSVGGGVATVPGSSRAQGQVGASYSIPLP